MYSVYSGVEEDITDFRFAISYYEPHIYHKMNKMVRCSEFIFKFYLKYLNANFPSNLKVPKVANNQNNTQTIFQATQS